MRKKWIVERFAELLYECGLMYLDRNEEGDKEKGLSASRSNSGSNPKDGCAKEDREDNSEEAAYSL